MALFHTTVLDNQIKALDTIGTAQGSIATFDTDKAERLVKCVCDIPANASGINSLGFVQVTHNLWDEEWELGQYDITTGEKATNNNAIRSKNLIPIKAGTNQQVYFKIPNGVRVYFYGRNKNYLGGGYSYVISSSQSITFSASNAYYFTFYTGNTTTYGNNISINYDYTDSQYHAFEGKSIVVDFGESITDGATLDLINGVLTRNDLTTKQLDSYNIVSLDNKQNVIYNNCGDTSLKYIMTVGKAIS